MAFARSWFAHRPFPRGTDLACWWQAWFGETLFERQILVLDQRFVVVCCEFVTEVLLDETNLIANIVDGDGSESHGRWKGRREVRGHVTIHRLAITALTSSRRPSEGIRTWDAGTDERCAYDSVKGAKEQPSKPAPTPYPAPVPGSQRNPRRNRLQSHR